MTPPPVAFVDTETLGLDADVHPIWEVAIIRPDGQEISFQVRVTPRELSLAHPKALEIGRFEERYDRHAALDPSMAAFMVSAQLDGMHLAGAVVSFDEERLRRLCWAHSQPVTWHYHLIDVEALVVGYLARCARQRPIGHSGSRDDSEGAEEAMELLDLITPPWRSDDLTAALGIHPDTFDKHTALGDARWAKAIYEAVMGT